MEWDCMKQSYYFVLLRWLGLINYGYEMSILIETR